MRHKLPDPVGMIARVRARLNPKCAVKESPFCDVIISMRMQGMPLREIEEFLVSHGEQFRIAAPTIHRNLAETKLEVRLSYAEEMLERMGGMVEINLIREMSQTIWTQKQRIDRLVRREEEKRKEPGYENHSDRRLRFELESYSGMLRSLHTILEEVPEKAMRAAEAEELRLAAKGIHVSKDAAAVLRDLILNDEIVLGPEDTLQ